MSTSLPASSQLVSQCEQARQSFYHKHAHLGQEHCDQLWAVKEAKIVDSIFGIVNTSHNPHSKAMRAGAHTAIERRSSESTMHGQRTQAHKRGRFESTPLERNARALHGGMAIPAQEFDPSCYIASNASNNIESMYDNAFQQHAVLRHPSRLSVPSMPSGMTCDFVNECSVPNTPLSMTNASTFDGTMSRSPSLGGQFEMLRLNSNASSISNTEELSFSDHTISSVKSNDLTDTARSHLIRDVGFGSFYGDDSLLPAHVYPMSTTSSSQSQHGHSQLDSIAEVHEAMVQNMHLNMFSEDGIVAQQYTTASLPSRQLAASHHQYSADRHARPTKQESQYVPQLIDIASADGRSTRAGASMPIPRTTYKRPAKEKQYCTKCNDHPEGFRGDHELTRHMQRQHSTKRKCWIAVDKSEDGKFLSNCKHCRNKKKYYAYYNLAAHLRRIHFNKKEKAGRGRRRRGAPIPESEKKGGKSGGDHPSIDWLKDNGWIIEVDEYVSTDSPDPVDNMDDEEEGFDDYAMHFGQSIDKLNDGYQPAFADSNWQPSCGTLDLAALSYSTSGLAMTPEASNYPNFYITDGTAYGQDSYSNFQLQQQVNPTAAPFQVYMQH